jgi:excisionase family DNA binding protein
VGERKERMNGKLLNIDAAAEALSIKRSTLRAWVSRSKIGSIRVGRAVRVPESEIQRVLREGTRPAREPLEKKGKFG